MGTSDGGERLQNDYSAPVDLAMSVHATPGNHDSANVDSSSGSHGNSSPLQNLKQSVGSSPHWNANYIPPGKSTEGRRTSSPTELASGARQEELLRRLSLAGQRPKFPEVADYDPRTAHPELNLSGNVISATFCVPFKIDYGRSGEWVCLILV